jgi:Rha family phage regulatory protein
MKFFPAIDPYAVHIKDNNVITTSIVVAKMFGKQHKDILRKIKTIECSDVFRSANFCAHPYTNSQNGETYIQYDITKDGFIFLVMGFTGKKASHMKELYIDAFNRMELALQKSEVSIPQTVKILMTITNGQIPRNTTIPSDAMIIRPSELASLIESDEHFPLSEIPNILKACSKIIISKSIS